MGAKLTYPQDDIPVDRTFIVTGGNTGIGYQTAKCIAKLGGRAIIACRSEERANKAISRMQKEHQEEVAQETKAREDEASPPKTEPSPPPTKDTTAATDADSKEDDSKSADPATQTKDSDNSSDPSKEETTPASAEKEEAASVPPLKVEFMKLDLASLQSTMDFVNAYKAKGYPLHVLICNAGLGLVPYEKTSDGYELQFQVNYLSHFLLTLHLLPLLRESAPNSRIINLSSMMHSAGTLDMKNMQAEMSYDRIKFYSNSKVYQIMNMYSLSQRLPSSGISIFSIHPGYVDSEFIRGSADSKLHLFVELASKVLRLKRNIEDGAMTSLVAALDNKYDGQTALYFKDCKPANPSALARDVDKQEILWQHSLDCLKDYISDDLLKDLQLPESTEEQKSGQKDDKEEENKPEDDVAKDQTKTDDDDKATPEAESKSAKETEPKQEEVTESKSEAESDSKPEAESVSKPEAESDSKPEEKMDSKPNEATTSDPDEEETESKPDED